MAWVYLLLAGSLEIIWAYTMSLSDGFSKIIPTIITLFLATICFYLLEKAISALGAGLAYAVFTGIGTVGTAALGIFIFKEPINFLQLFAIGLILFGIIGLKLSDAKEEHL